MTMESHSSQLRIVQCGELFLLCQQLNGTKPASTLLSSLDSQVAFLAHPSCFRTISQSHYEQSFDQILCGRKLVPSPYFQDFGQRLHWCFKQEKPKDQ